MAIDVSRKLITVAEYTRMGEAGVFDPDDRLELVEGEILQMNPIGRRHAAVVNRLNSTLGARLGAVAIVSVQSPAIMDAYSEPQPDVTVLRPRPDDYESGLPTPPDILLLVEVSDTTLRHDRRKLKVYARNGVPEVWLVVLAIDPARDCIHVHTDPTPDGYKSVRTYRRGSAITLSAFPEHTIPVDDILKSPPAPSQRP